MSLQQFKRLAGPALIAGGLLWMAASVASIVLGMLTGQVDPTPGARSPALAYVGIWFLPFGTLFLGLGLLGMFARLGDHARVLGIISVVFASIGMALSIVALIGIIASSSSLNSLGGGFGSFAVIIGSGFMGCAALRARALPRSKAVILLITGFVTVPIIFVTPLPIGPGWATDMLGFLLSAIVYGVMGATLAAKREHAQENVRGASVSAAAQAK
jgi:hypothetical protein